MAKISAHGQEVARAEQTDGDRGIRYRAMTDGVVLKQYRVFGEWGTPTISNRLTPERAAAAVRKQAAKEGWS